MPRPHEELLLEHLHQVFEGEVAPSADLQRVCGQDAEFNAMLQRRVRQVRALRQLTRVRVPADLAGRVVAASNGGYRQDRAVRMLESMGAETAPVALEAAVRHEVERPFPFVTAPPAGGPHPAPAELDQRVARELEDLPEASARRMAGRLRRRLVPAALDRRMAWSEPRRPGLATALMVVSALALGGWLRFGQVEAADRNTAMAVPSLSFEVVPLSPAQALDQGHPLMALSGFAGGVLEGSRR